MKDALGLSVVTCAAIELASGYSALGQSCPPVSIRYRHLDLGAIGFDPEVDEIGTFGINARGQVAFALLNSGSVRAAVWLPCADVLPVGTTLLPGEVPSIARDLNIHGQVVGQVGGIEERQGLAVLWEIDVAGAPPTELGTFGDAVFQDWSRAIAINDEQPAFVAGESAIRHECLPCSSNVPADVIRGFRVEIGATLVLEELLPLMCNGDLNSSAHARDIGFSVGAAPPLIVGSSGTLSYADPGGPLCKATGPCEPPRGIREPAAWGAPLELIDQTPKSAQAYGINIGDEVVGFRYENVGGCLQSALYWPSPMASAVELPPTTVASQALAINAAVDRQVVGRDVGNDLAVIWENTSGNTGSWCFDDLNDLVCVDQPAMLKQGYDINDSGWIVAIGDHDPGPGVEFHAYLLYPCPADTNHSFTVDIDDFLNIRLFCWGTDGVDCPSPGDNSDVNCDGVVDVDDLVAYILAQGCCPGFECCSEEAQATLLAQRIEESGLEWPNDWLSVVEAMATGDVGEQLTYTEWLAHYLSEEHTLGANCPGVLHGVADPFGNH